MVNRTRGRNWLFTDFDVSDEEKKKYIDLYEEGELRYLLIGFETTKEGREHFQGYMCFKNTVRFAKIKKLFPVLNFRYADGDSLQNYNYCTKGGQFEEWGVRPMSSKERGLKDHEKWLDVIKTAEEGTVKEEYPGEFVRYNSTLKKMYKPVLDDVEMSGLWLYGPTGSGKSKMARDMYPGIFIKLKNKWWDHYDYEESVLIDDITQDHSKLVHYLLNWVDHYPFPAEYKGGVMMIRPQNIVVTSNYKIEEVFSDVGERTIGALKRRFKVEYVGMDDVESQPSDYTQRIWRVCDYPNCDCEGCCDHATDLSSSEDVRRVDIEGSLGLIRSDQEGFDDLITRAQEAMNDE